jgi:hypothetical protein
MSFWLELFICAIPWSLWNCYCVSTHLSSNVKLSHTVCASSLCTRIYTTISSWKINLRGQWSSVFKATNYEILSKFLSVADLVGFTPLIIDSDGSWKTRIQTVSLLWLNFFHSCSDLLLLLLYVDSILVMNCSQDFPILQKTLQLGAW